MTPDPVTEAGSRALQAFQETHGRNAQASFVAELLRPCVLLRLSPRLTLPGKDRAALRDRREDIGESAPWCLCPREP